MNEVQQRTYDEACAAAATAQRLDPVVLRMRNDGLDVKVEQTGGFVMVACVYVDDEQWVGVTESQDGFGYMVCEYVDSQCALLGDELNPVQVSKLVSGWLAKARITCSMCGGTDHTERQRTDDGEWDEDCEFHPFIDGDGNDRRSGIDRL